MTRPSELKPREDEHPGTLWADYRVGARTPEMVFTVTPDIVREYATSVDADLADYVVDGRTAAPPNVLAVYLLATVYRLYPPTQGIILTDVSWRFHHPIWADEDTEIGSIGRIAEKYEKRGKHFVRWSAEFRRKADGLLLTEAANTMYVPLERYEKR